MTFEMEQSFGCGLKGTVMEDASVEPRRMGTELTTQTHGAWFSILSLTRFNRPGPVYRFRRWLGPFR
jgi:hypothetical protein